MRRYAFGAYGLAFVLALWFVGSAAAETALERVQHDGLKIGFANEAPFSFSLPDGNIAGSDYDLAKLIFQRLGVTKVEGVLVNFGSLIPGLKAHRFDIIAAGLYVRPERCGLILFSEPNLVVADMLLVPAGNPKAIHSFADVAKNPAIKVGGTVGGLARDAIDDGVPKEQIVEFPDWISAIAALKAARIDAALQTTVTARWTVASAKDPSIEVAAPFIQPVINGKPKANYTSFAFNPDDKDLRDAFNGGLAKVLGSPEHLAILAKYGMTTDEVPKNVTVEQLCAH